MAAYLVIGMPRSGTSLVAGILHALGVSMGERFQKPSDANPTGFFADMDLDRESWLAICGRENQLAALVQQRNQQPHWGYKCGAGGLVVPAFAEALGSRPTIIATKRPRERSRASLARLGIKFEYDRLYRSIIEATQPYIDGEADLVIEYEAIVENPAAGVQQLARLTGVPAKQAAVEFVRPELWRAR